MSENKKYSFIIEEKDDGMRVDAVLSSLLEDESRSFIQKLIKAGNLEVNGKACDSKKYKLTQGDEVSLEIPEPELLQVAPENIPLDIVYEDEDVLVVNKPRGMVVHPAAGNPSGTLVNALMYHCGDTLSSINGVVRPGIVHRIDKDTSGLLMIAKNDKAHASLSEQLANHSNKRAYLAIAYNNFKEDKGTINAPIGRDPKNRFRYTVIYQNSKFAVTHYEVLERFGTCTLVKAVLETGRTHQIRVHMNNINHPLVGDTLYGSARNNMGVEGQLLHAYLLGFNHPRTGEYLEFKVDPPAEFMNILNKLRKKTEA